MLDRVKGMAHLKMEARIAVLEQARIDLKRLGSIEPALSDAATFAETYIQCQSLVLKCLASEYTCFCSLINFYWSCEIFVQRSRLLLSLVNVLICFI